MTTKKITLDLTFVAGQLDELAAALRIVEAARAFVYETENWDAYQELQGSMSAALPVEFMALGDAVSDAFGPPPIGDELARVNDKMLKL